MTRFISLLRGINVAGSKKILMKELQQLYLSLGFENCRTYIQSGNVIFESKLKPEEAEIQIKESIKKQFGYEVPVAVYDLNQWKKFINGNPFSKETDFINRLYLSFLLDTPEAERQLLFDSMDFGPDKVNQKGKLIYILFNGKASDSKLSNNLIEQKLKVSTTTRNWKTMIRLAEMAEE